MSDGDSLNIDGSSFASRMKQPPRSGSVDGFLGSAANSRRVQPRPENMPPVQPRGYPATANASHNPVPAATRQIHQPQSSMGQQYPSPRQQLHLQSNPRTQSNAQPVAAKVPAQSQVIDRTRVSNPFGQQQYYQPQQSQNIPPQQHMQMQPQQHHSSSQPQASGQPNSQHHQAQQTGHQHLYQYSRQINTVAPAAHHQERQQFQNVAQEHHGAKKNKSKNPSTAVKAGMVGLAVAVFAIGMGVSLNTLHQNKLAQEQLTQLTRQADQKTVASTNTQPKGTVLGSNTTQSNATFTVLPDQPKNLIIPKLQLNSLAQPVALTDKGLIASPSDIKNVGWYSASAKPGEIPTAMVFNGALGSTTQPGPFNQLDKLTISDSIQVIRGDGQTYNYKVVKTAAFDPATQNTGSLLAPSRPGVPSLVLITTVPAATNTPATQGTVVYAEQI